MNGFDWLGLAAAVLAATPLGAWGLWLWRPREVPDDAEVDR